MSNEARDELAAIIDDRWHGYGYNPLGAADAILADGWRKLVLDDATVERAARALDPKAWDETAIMFVAHSQSPEDARASRQRYACADARRVLAAAVKEEL